MKNHDEEYFGKAPVCMQNGIEDFLAMGNMVEDIPSESTSKDDHLFMYWVDKNITEIEDQICTIIACTSEGLSDTYDWK